MVVKRTPYVTLKYVAGTLRKSPGYVQRLVRDGVLEGRKQTDKWNSRWIIVKASFETFLASLERNGNG